MWKSDFGRIKIKKIWSKSYSNYSLLDLTVWNNKQKMTHKLIKSFGFSSIKDYLMSCFVNTEKAKI